MFGKEEEKAKEVNENKKETSEKGTSEEVKEETKWTTKSNKVVREINGFAFKFRKIVEITKHRER